MPTVTLDSIRADIEAKYAPVVIEFGPDASVTLVQIMRLGKEKRKALLDAEKQREAAAKAVEDSEGDENAFDEEASVEHLKKVIRIIAKDPSGVEGLFAATGDDLLTLSEIVTKWREGTQAGEAQSSAS